MVHHILIVGSGFAAQSIARRLIAVGLHDFHLLERRDKMGGTWINQAYPGAAVDIQSPLYSLQGEPYDWTEMFAGQDELSRYTNHIIDTYGLRDKTTLNCTVLGATWDADAREWIAETDTRGTLRTRFLINASGQLSQPVIPPFKGIARFQGPSFHTAHWDTTLDLTGKSVALIGSGASAAQIIPAIAEHVAHLHVFQRTPHWVLPRPDHVFRPWQRRLLKRTWAYRTLRQMIRFGIETRIFAFKYSRLLRTFVARNQALKLLKRQIPDAALRARLTPDYEIGCKRIILSSTLFPALQRPNVTLHTGPGEEIGEITQTGLSRTDGTEVQADVIVYATGYDATDGYISYPVAGPQGTVTEAWSEQPSAYVGSSMAGFPNLFLMNGPFTAMAHSSALLMLEAQAVYISKAIMAAGAGTVAVTEAAEAAFAASIERAVRGTVWDTGGCESWYKNKNGKVTGIYPGFAFTFQRSAARFVVKDHILTR